ncbi:MAG: hypothetical protein ACLP4R_28400 [Solirubrobacteraceae bacterium]
MADAALGAALDGLASRPSVTELEGLAAGRILTAGRTIDACRTLIDEAARACGSGPFARAETLDRARRDLEVFLLQHRLDPLLARAGHEALVDR